MKDLMIFWTMMGLLLVSNGFNLEIDQAFQVGEMNYNGNGFNKELQDLFRQSINDATIFYNNKSDYQASHIKKTLEDHKKGIWYVVIAQQLNITKITDVSTEFSYWSDADTWAFWYNVSQHSPNTLYIAIYNGSGEKSATNVTTTKEGNGGQITPQLLQVIKSVTDTLDSTQEMAKYIQKYDGRKWTILSFRQTYNGLSPKAYGALDVDGVWVTFNASVSIGKQKYSQIIFA